MSLDAFTADADYRDARPVSHESGSIHAFAIRPMSISIADSQLEYCLRLAHENMSPYLHRRGEQFNDDRWRELAPLAEFFLVVDTACSAQKQADAELRSELMVARPLAEALNLPLVPPCAGFDSEQLQQLALACAPPGSGPNRFVVERLMRHVWQGGVDPLERGRFTALLEAVAPRRAFDALDVQAELSAASRAAKAGGVSRIPTFAVPSLERQFDTVDALPQLARALAAAG